MATDEVAMLNALAGAALALMIAIRSLPMIAIDVPGPSWKTISAAEACFQSDVAGCRLRP
jgi:hypothetical protein